MKIISHRGYWKTPPEQNTPKAFDRSFRLGFGTETDFRDHNGTLVIAHDIPDHEPLLAETCFQRLAQHNPDLPLAINIKADGLQSLLKNALERHGISNYFFFDMSVPDAVTSQKMGLPVFTRQSDIEPLPAFYDQAVGVWMDSFFDEAWLTPDRITQHLEAGKKVCVVSPELHGRTHLPCWKNLHQNVMASHPNLLLCTDFPEEAAALFKDAQD